MIKIIFVCNGNRTEVNAVENETLLQLAERCNIPLVGSCGGACLCGSCCVEIESKYIDLLPKADFSEQDILECLPTYKPTSRLACQVKITKEMDGMVVLVN